MNILVLNWRDIRHPRAGGAEVKLHKTYEPLVKDHSVTLISSQFSGAPPQELINGIRVIRFGNDFNFWLLCFLRLPGLIRRYDIDFVVEDYNKLPFFTPLRTTKPLLIQMHHLWKRSIFRESSFPVALFVWLCEQSLRVVYRRSPFAVVSPSTRKELETMGPSPRQITVIYNGCDLTFYRPAEKQAEEHRGMTFLWIGRIQQYKGIIDALKAFRCIQHDHPEAVLHIAGKGPFEE
ncbi:MAG: glycosyltransferase family 4 protein, partial [Fibrobacterota bacterium]